MGRALALRDRALVEVLYGSGLRRQEACDLVLAGLDFEHDSLRVVGKGGKARTVPLTEPAVAALRAWLAEGRPRLVSGRAHQAAARAPVFVSRGGRALDGSTVYRVVARELRASGRAGRAAPAAPRRRAPTCWRGRAARAARTCAWCRRCSATRASRPPSATPA